MAYDVTIKGTVRKTIRIEDSINKEDAIVRAHEIFTIANDGLSEHYDEEMVNIKEI